MNKNDSQGASESFQGLSVIVAPRDQGQGCIKYLCLWEDSTNSASDIHVISVCHIVLSANAILLGLYSVKPAHLGVVASNCFT